MSLPWLKLLLLCALSFKWTLALSEQDLQIEVISKPEDCERVTVETDLVYIHFKSYYGNGTMIESSYENGLPMYIALGRGIVIKGLDDALVGMCKGEIRRIVIPPHLGYGEKGFKSDKIEIPPGETLVMEVEMVFYNGIESINTVFSTLDIDGNKKLDQKEVEFVLKSSQYLPSNIFTKKMDEEQLHKEFMKAFEEADTDKDSYINFDEFLIVNGLKDAPLGPDDINTDEKIPEPEGRPLNSDDQMKEPEGPPRNKKLKMEL